MLGDGSDPLEAECYPGNHRHLLVACGRRADAVACLVLTSFLALVATIRLASRVIGSCVLLQLGYVVGAFTHDRRGSHDWR